MALFSQVSDVRTLGNLPASDKLADTIIQPHLDSAGRELTSMIGDYSGATDDKLADCKEAECCLAIAYLLPVLNTLYSNGAASIQKQLGEIELMFYGPDDLKKVIDEWRDRASSRIAQYVTSGDRKPIGWHVI